MELTSVDIESSDFYKYSAVEGLSIGPPSWGVTTLFLN